MTTLVNIDVLNPDSTPWAYATVAVRLVDAGAGGVTTPGVIAGTQRVRCDSAGHAEIALTPNASITPANTFYAFTVERSSPSVTRKITVPVSPSEIDWDDGAYQVITDTPPVYFPAATSGDVGDVPRVNATGDGYELAAPSGGAGSVADDTHAATSKTTPVNADELPLVDSAASFGLKKLTWANLKATLKTYFDTLYPSGSGTSTGTNTGDQTLPTLSSLGAVPMSRTLAGLDLSADRTASALRTALGLVIGTDVLAPNGSGASLTGIYVPGGTDVAVADGGTGASTASGARTNLGLVIGTDVLAPNGSGASLTGLPDTSFEWYRGTGYHSIPGRIQNNTSISRNACYFVPFRISNTATAIRIGILVGSAGGTGSTIRLGIYNSHATTGQPTTRLVDGGTVASSGTGALEVTISQSLTPGVYWLACNATGGTSDPAVNSTDPNGDPLLIDNVSSTTQVGGYIDWSANSASGALPSTFTLGDYRRAAAPRIWVKF